MYTSSGRYKHLFLLKGVKWVYFSFIAALAIQFVFFFFFLQNSSPEFAYQQAVFECPISCPVCSVSCPILDIVSPLNFSHPGSMES